MKIKQIKHFKLKKGGLFMNNNFEQNQEIDWTKINKEESERESILDICAWKEWD